MPQRYEIIYSLRKRSLKIVFYRTVQASERKISGKALSPRSAVGRHQTRSGERKVRHLTGSQKNHFKHLFLRFIQDIRYIIHFRRK